MNDIPRYKSSPRLQTKFVRNVDHSGDQVFTQLERSGSLAIYRRDKVDGGQCVGFEVITIGVIKAGTVFAKGSVPTTEDKESYPGAESFGFKAWAFNNEKAAWDRFDKILMG